MQVYKIDNNGFYIGIEEVEELDEFCVSTSIMVGYVKPKWNGTQWFEGATSEEISEYINQNSPSLSSQIESLIKQIAETDYQIIKCYEYSLVNKELHYNIITLHNLRQTLRDEINQLEQLQGGVNDAKNI